MSAEVSAVAYSPNGQHLAVAHHRTVTVYNTAEWKVSPLTCPFTPDPSAAVTPLCTPHNLYCRLSRSSLRTSRA